MVFSHEKSGLSSHALVEDRNENPSRKRYSIAESPRTEHEAKLEMLRSHIKELQGKILDLAKEFGVNEELQPVIIKLEGQHDKSRWVSAEEQDRHTHGAGAGIDTKGYEHHYGGKVNDDSSVGHTNFITNIAGLEKLSAKIEQLQSLTEELRETVEKVGKLEQVRKTELN